MSDPFISFIPENDEQFKGFLSGVIDKVEDFRIPFGLIAQHWYRGNKKIFALKGPGLWGDDGADLSANYKVQKKARWGFVYPILKASGRLAASLSSKTHADAEYFVGRKELILGTSVPYGKYHQSDRTPRTKLPQRKFIFIDGGPAERAKDALISGRLEAWTNIVNDYVKQVLTGDANV